MENNFEKTDMTGSYLAGREKELKSESMQRLERLKALDPAYIQQKQQQETAANQTSNPTVNRDDVIEIPTPSGRNDVGQRVQSTNLTRQIVGGATDAGREAIQTMNELNPIGSKPFLVFDFGEGNNDPEAQDYIDGTKKGSVPVISWPNIEKPTTLGQGITRSISQFVTGFLGAGKVLKPIKAATGAAQTAKMAVQGAITDFTAFDPHEERLSNLVQEYPVLQNPITEYLQADPNDTAIEGRFKNALEGAGIGGAIDGFIKTVRVIRSARAAKQSATQAPTVQPVQNVVKDEDLSALGDINQPIVAKQTAPAPVIEAPAQPVAKTETVPSQTPDPIAPVVDLVLPKDLAGAKPRFNIGQKVNMLTFEDDVDKAIFIVSQNKKSARDADYRDWLKNVAKLTDEEIAQKSTDIRARIKELASSNESDSLVVPRESKPIAKEENIDVQPAIEIPTTAADTSKLDAAMKTTETGVTEDFAAKGLINITQKGTDDTYVNFSRIETTDDVKSIIAQTADAFAKDIDEAARGVITQEETAKLAKDMGLSVEDLLSRRQGQTMNAETALASRRLLTASAEKLQEIARKASGANASDTDRFLFRKMLATHHAIQTEVFAARTETARSLASWRIPAGGAERARAIEQALESFGGSNTTSELAKRIASLDSPQAIAQVTDKAVMARTLNAVKESYVLGLLWSPKTHIVNVSSNTLVAMSQIYERKAGEWMSAIVGRQAGDGIAPGEAGAMWYGLRTSIGDAFRYASTALRTGQAGTALGKLDIPPEPAISAEALGIKNQTLGKVVDIIGKVIRLPGRALVAEDEFFKTIGYRAELSAQAYRQAYAEGLYKDPKAFGERVNEIVKNPPENIRIASADAAMYNTFTNKTGEWGQAFMTVRDNLNIGPIPVGTMILPFVRTPTNIFRYAVERSPLAPMVSQWRADIAAGGARADLAASRMATGSAIMFLASDWAANGTITGGGPDDPGEREALIRQGWQPYSMRLGDKYYAYNRIDPVAMLLGVAADLQAMVNRYDIEPEEMDDVNEIIGGTIAAIANASIDKTYMTGISDIVQAIEDPDRYASDYISKLAGALVPGTTALSTIEQIADPAAREVMGQFDYAQSRIPGLSKNLVLKRDLWGKPMEPGRVFGATYDLLSPAAVKERKESPIDREIVTLNADIRRIAKKVEFSTGEPGTSAAVVNFRDFPKVYDAYVTLAGNELKLPKYSNLGAKEYLDGVVSGSHPHGRLYKTLADYEGEGTAPTGTREAFIQKVMQDYRKAARAEIMKDPQFAEFQAHIRKKQRERREQSRTVR
jgi:hypothetical protein